MPHGVEDSKRGNLFGVHFAVNAYRYRPLSRFHHRAALFREYSLSTRDTAPWRRVFSTWSMGRFGVLIISYYLQYDDHTGRGLSDYLLLWRRLRVLLRDRVSSDDNVVSDLLQ